MEEIHITSFGTMLRTRGGLFVLQPGNLPGSSDAEPAGRRSIRGQVQFHGFVRGKSGQRFRKLSDAV
ncbi:MAG: hypothetical protein EPO28_12900 [Saprospiraceae bacterium]|nr:MAG: hypothetical protein EPO28_12900 [Saprospiraceae bacterium]